MRDELAAAYGGVTGTVAGLRPTASASRTCRATSPVAEELSPPRRLSSAPSSGSASAGSRARGLHDLRRLPAPSRTPTTSTSRSDVTQGSPGTTCSGRTRTPAMSCPDRLRRAQLADHRAPRHRRSRWGSAGPWGCSWPGRPRSLRLDALLLHVLRAAFRAIIAVIAILDFWGRTEFGTSSASWRSPRGLDLPLVRAATLATATKEYVTAAKSQGATCSGSCSTDVFPNVAPSLLAVHRSSRSAASSRSRVRSRFLGLSVTGPVRGAT